MRYTRGSAIRRFVLAAALAAAGALLWAGSARADSASMRMLTATGEPDAVAGVPRLFVLNGTATTSTNVWVKYRHASGPPCAASVDGDAGLRLPSTSDREFYGASVSGPFDFRKQITWESSGAGTYLFCIWLTSSSRDSVTPIAQEITFRAPAGTIAVAFGPAIPRVDEPLAITLTGTSEVPAELYAKARPAGGDACAATYVADSGLPVFSGARVAAGEFVITTQVFVSPPGQYMLCLWLARSSGDLRPVAGPQSQPFTIAAAPAPCVVPKVASGMRANAVKRRLRANNCTPGTVRYVRSRRVPRRAVVRLSRRPGTRLAPGARVTIYVSVGRPRPGGR